MVASKTSIIFAAVALGAASTYAIPTAYNRNLARRAESTLAARDVVAAAGAYNSTTGGASGIAVAAVSSTSGKTKPYRDQQHKDEGYESSGEGHKDEEGRHHKDKGHHHHKGHHKGHHHHHHHEDEEIFEAGFEMGYAEGYETALIAGGNVDFGKGHGHHHHHEHHGHHHEHHGHRHHHHHDEESAVAGAKVSANETVTIETQATIEPPAHHHSKRDLAHGLGLEDDFFMKRDYEEDEFMY